MKVIINAKSLWKLTLTLLLILKVVTIKMPSVRNKTRKRDGKDVQIKRTNNKATSSEKSTKRKLRDAPNCEVISKPKRKCSEKTSKKMAKVDGLEVICKPKRKCSEKTSKKMAEVDGLEAVSKPKRKCSEKTCKKMAEVDDLEEEEDGFVEIGDRSAPRKSHDPSKWKRNLQAQAKRQIYVEQSEDSIPTCKHKKKSPYKCGEVLFEDVVSIRTIFAKHTKTIDENRYLLSQIIVEGVKRHRPKNNFRSKKLVAPSYYLRLKSAKRIRVCKVAFGTVFGVGRKRLTGLNSFYHKSGEAKHEARGGDHKLAKFGVKRDSVVNFIKKLKARESHYGRNKSRRLYLPHELKSIKNLCRIYNSNQEPSNQVKYGFFKGIFKKRFNLAFGTPRTDVCTFCLRYKHLLIVEKDPIKKQFIRGRLRVHKLRAKAFYKLLKERKAHIKTLAGDCQQNQAMPKIPDQAAYFSRQLNLYNFTMAEYIDKDETMNFAFTWTEDQSKKGSNQIASAVCHKLMTTKFDGITTVRIFFDGCGGQNKNVQVLCMASWWLVNKAPKSIEGMQLVFPVTGHSFLPPDRVFGRIEKDIRKEEEILSPAKYHEIIGKHETVVQLEKDWKVYDWKKYTVERFKSAASLPFKISQTKIFEIRRSKVGSTVEIKAEKNYRNANSKFETVCKKGMNLSSSPQLLKEKVVVSDAKLDDVYSLLKNRFGADWKSDERLSYFKQFFKPNYNA